MQVERDEDNTATNKWKPKFGLHTSLMTVRKRYTYELFRKREMRNQDITILNDRLRMETQSTNN